MSKLKYSCKKPCTNCRDRPKEQLMATFQRQDVLRGENTRGIQLWCFTPTRGLCFHRLRHITNQPFRSFHSSYRTSCRQQHYTHVFILLLLGITIRKAGKENQGEAHNSSLSTGGFARDYNKKVGSLLFALFPYSAKGASQSNGNVLFKPDSKNVTKITSSSFLFLKMLSSTSPTANMIICTRCRLTKPLSVR